MRALAMFLFLIAVAGWACEPTPAAPKAPAATAQGVALPPLPAGAGKPPADAQRTGSGIAWKVLEAGTGESRATPSNHVTFHVKAWASTGQPLVNTEARGAPKSGPLGRNIKVWTEMLQLMREGERSRFWVPAQLLSKEKVDPEAMVIFDVHLLEVRALNLPAGLDPQQAELVLSFNKLYAGSHIESRNIQWLGVEIQQNPCDMVMMQQILFDVKPDLVIETGTYTGGGAFYLASLLELIDPVAGEVVTIDLNPMVEQVSKQPIFKKRVTVITGDSVGDETLAKVAEHAAKAKRVLVTLDSLHTAAHVAKELERYAPLVTPGSYIVVQDTHVSEFFPVNPASDPIVAVHAFLEKHPEFVQDRDRERLLLSYYRGGFLKRIK